MRRAAPTVILLVLLTINVAHGAEETKDGYDHAINDASQAIHRNPKNADAYCARAGAQLAKKRTNEAIADASRAITLDPEDAEAYRIRGNARFLRNQNVEALHDLSEAIGLEPSLSDVYFLRGLIRAKRGALQKAIADFTSTLELDPDATAALVQRAEVYSKLYQFPLAVADYSELVERDPENAELYNHRGFARASLLDLEAAIADYTEAIRLRPQFEEVYYNRGVAYANMNAHESPNFQEPAPWGDQNHWRAAIADLSTAIAYRPDRVDSYRFRGFAHNGVGENDEAIADLKEAIRLDPKEWWARAGLADVYEMRGDFRKAQREYDLAARLEKQNPDVFVHRSNFYARRQDFAHALTEANQAVQLAPNYPLALFARATANHFLKQHDLAIRDLTLAIEVDTQAVNPPPGWANSVRKPSQLAAEYDCRGTVYEVIGDHNRAIADHSEAICLDPNNASWWINLADVYQDQKKFHDAMSCYTQAIRLESDKPLCWLGLARLFKQTGQCDQAMAALSTVFDRGKPTLLGSLLHADIEQCLGNIQGAIADYNQAIRLEPSNTLLWLELAKLYKDAQEYHNAAATLSKILQGEPTNLQARISRANLYQKLGAADKAIAEASEAVQLHPKKAEAYSARATLYNYGGNYDKAIADADYALQLNPSDPDAYYARGFATLQLKDYAGAIHDLTEEIKLDPNHGSAWHCRGFALLKQRKYTEARADLLHAIKLNLRSAELFNSLAWLLSTCPDSAVRDGIRATEYINQALQLGPNQKDLWDTCAAVFAENGDFKNAIDWEARFLERKDLSTDERHKATERLALYRTDKPYREEPK